VRGRGLARLIAGCADDVVSGGRRVVHHRFGVTVVPAEPRRVISVGYEEHDLLLHLGVVPVLQRDYFGEQPCAVWPWSWDLLGRHRPATFATDEIPLDAVAAARPDLIMATNAGLHEATYDALSSIAPTVAQSARHPDWETPRDEHFLDVARCFGRQRLAQSLIDDTRLRVIAIAEEHPEWRGRVAASLTLHPEGVLVDLDGHSRGSLLLDLGFVLPSDLDGPRVGERHAILDDRGVGGLDRDLLLWVDGRDDPGTIAELPGRRSLDAHRTGREVYLDTVMTGAFTVQSPRAIAYLLDRLVPEIEAAIDGNPATLARSAVMSGLAP
jgi:iron complex transport system substrate-binding protein